MQISSSSLPSELITRPSCSSSSCTPCKHLSALNRCHWMLTAAATVENDKMVAENVIHRRKKKKTEEYVKREHFWLDTKHWWFCSVCDCVSVAAADAVKDVRKTATSSSEIILHIAPLSQATPKPVRDKADEFFFPGRCFVLPPMWKSLAFFKAGKNTDSLAARRFAATSAQGT